MADSYPWRYGTSYRTLEQIRAELLPHYHPEYLERLLAWLAYKGGEIGIGGHFREDGTQPDKPGFAPEGKSFHQNQKYSDGFIGACAVDLVKRSPNGGIHVGVSWDDVLPQGSAISHVWGLHCNVSNEAWHMQPIEIDGHSSWVSAGSPAPRQGYAFPGRKKIVVKELVFDKRRLLDTRETSGLRVAGKVPSGGTVEVQVPAGAKAVKVNLTAVDAAGRGFITAYPAATARPITSDLNYRYSDPCANQIDVPVTDGKFMLFVRTETHVIVDLVGVWM